VLRRHEGPRINHIHDDGFLAIGGIEE